tara:strand:- start:81 stop:419 length:339 start_codon:yes stop_codon:yes gene_type:complete
MMKKIYTHLLLIMASPALAFAQENGNVSGIIKANNLPEFVDNISSVINSAFTLLIALCILAILIGLFQSMTNVASPDEQKKARRVMLWGFLGVFVLISLIGILNLMKNTIVF